MADVDVVQELISAGVEFETDGTRIRWRQGNGRVTPQIVEAIRAEKPQVIGFLRKAKTGVATPQTSITGRPVTWTGKVVSLAEWRQLSDWERRGPDGRQWNGMTKRWELPKEGSAS